MGVMRPIKELASWKTACANRLDWPVEARRYHMNNGYRVVDDGCCTVGAKDESFGVGGGGKDL